MAHKVDAIAEQKRTLIARSEMYRQSMEADLRNIREAVAWVPRTFRAMRMVYPVLLLALPAAGFFLKKQIGRKRSPPKKGWLGKAATGIKIFRSVKPFWDGFREARRMH